MLSRLCFHLMTGCQNGSRIGVAGRGIEACHVLGEQRLKPCDVKPVLGQIVSEPRLVRSILGGIDLDESVAGFDGRAIGDLDRLDDTSLEGLDQLRPAARNDPPLRRGNDVDLPEGRPGDRDAEKRMIVPAMARPAGEAGVSIISSAAGKNSSSSRRLCQARGK